VYHRLLTEAAAGVASRPTSVLSEREFYLDACRALAAVRSGSFVVTADGVRPVAGLRVESGTVSGTAAAAEAVAAVGTAFQRLQTYSDWATTTKLGRRRQGQFTGGYRRSVW
jgi:hypothetical protein